MQRFDGAGRLAGLDLVRAGAMLLGLAYHASYAWLPDVGPWYFVADPRPTPALQVMEGVLHALRMEVFFTLSGFFSHLVFERRGPRFVVDRAKRLLVPFIVALPLTVGVDLVLRRASLEAGLMHPQFVPGVALRPWTGHLWFLSMLFLLCVLATLAPTIPRLATVRVRPWWLLLAAALPTLALNLLVPELKPAEAWFPRPVETLHFGLSFSVGWLLWPRRAELEPLAKVSKVFLVLGLGVVVGVFSTELRFTRVGPAAAALSSWLVSLGLMGWATTLPARERPWLRRLVDASYWVYLVHYPLVLALQFFFVAQVSWPGLLEYALTVGLVAALAFGSFELVVRRTPLAAWLGASTARR